MTLFDTVSDCNANSRHAQNRVNDKGFCVCKSLERTYMRWWDFSQYARMSTHKEKNKLYSGTYQSKVFKGLHVSALLNTASSSILEWARILALCAECVMPRGTIFSSFRVRNLRPVTSQRRKDSLQCSPSSSSSITYCMHS
jgi:hypothetical protein